MKRISNNNENSNTTNTKNNISLEGIVVAISNLTHKQNEKKLHSGLHYYVMLIRTLSELPNISRVNANVHYTKN
jgi:hypothetical protein